MGVCGEPGPYGPRRQKPHPMPPLPANREAEVLFPPANRLGWKPFPPPLAILSQPYRGRPACICCPCCLSYGCEANAKSDTAVTVIPEALKTGLCTLRAETLVREITVDARGHPNGVICRSAEGSWQEISALAIIVAASATETPRLLLNSRSKWFLTGLRNHQDQVGRHVNEDQGAVVFGFFDGVVGDSIGPGPSFAVDFQFEHAVVPAGGVIYNGFSRLPICVVETVPHPEGMKSWGREFKDFYREVDPEADVVARFKSRLSIVDGRPATTVRKLGRGRVVELAWWPGDDSLLGLVRQLLPGRRSLLAAPVPVGVLPVPHADDSLFIVNTMRQKMPVQLGHGFKDRISGGSLEGTAILTPFQVVWLEQTA